MYGRLNVWKVGCMEGCMEGWMDGRMYRRLDGWKDVWKVGWMEGCKDVRLAKRGWPPDRFVHRHAAVDAAGAGHHRKLLLPVRRTCSPWT